MHFTESLTLFIKQHLSEIKMVLHVTYEYESSE